METPPTNAALPKSKLRWYQYSLRTFLVVVMLIAVGMGLLMRDVQERRAVLQRQKEAVAAIEKLGRQVGYAVASQSVLASYPAWLRWILGDEEYRPVTDVVLSKTPITDVGMQYLGNLTALQSLDLDNTQITDAGLENLSKLTALQWLDLEGTPITDAGLQHLGKLSTLQILELNNTQITDAGLQHLGKLSVLQILDLDNTQITDAGLEHLNKLTALKTLDLDNTKITDAGLAKLRAALPNCRVVWSPKE